MALFELTLAPVNAAPVLPADAQTLRVLALAPVLQGAKGDPGGATDGYIAAAALGGHRVVRALFDGRVDYASNDALAHANSVIGITTQAAAADAQIQVQAIGRITEPSWAWTEGLPVFAGVNGLLTQSPPAAPAAAFSLVVGVATSPTSLNVAIKAPLALL